MVDFGNNIFQSIFGGGNILGAAQATASAARAVGEAKAGALEKNAQLLRFDAQQYRSVGQDVFRTAVRQGLQRVGSAGSQYVAGGVQLTGSAGAVLRDINRESQAEAAAQRNQYEFAARKSALQADIAQYQAGLERQAAEFQAQSVIQQAQSNFEQQKAKYLLNNLERYEQAKRVAPNSFSGDKARRQIALYEQALGATAGGGYSEKLMGEYAQALGLGAGNLYAG